MKIKHIKIKNKQNLFFALLLTLLLLFFAGFQYLFGAMDIDHTEVSEEELNIDTSKKEKYSQEEIKNIALFGIDSRQNDDTGRSDAIMVVSVNLTSGKIKLISIARDTYVEIPGESEKTKINHAYAYGSAQLAMATLNKNFNLDISDYVTVNFEQCADIIDAFGGVDITITEAEKEELNRLLSEDKTTEKVPDSGLVHLNGAQALMYTRIRMIDNDDMRTMRQRTVLSALFQKINEIPYTQYPSLIRQFMPMVKTSFKFSEILKISSIFLSKDVTLEQCAIPNAQIEAEGVFIDDIWYYVYDLNEASSMLEKYIYEDIPFTKQELSAADL